MRPRSVMAVGASALLASAFACSLLTPLSEPRDAGASTDGGPLCTPEVLVDLGSSAVVTSLYVDTVLGRAFFAATTAGTVYALSLDAGVSSTPTPVATGLQQLGRITGTQHTGQSYVYIAAGGSAAGGGLYSLPPDGGLQTILAGSVMVDGSTFPVHANGLTELGIFPPSLYWTNCPQNSCPSSQVLRTDLASNTTTLLATVDAAAHDIVVTEQGAPWWATGTGSLETLGDAGLRDFACGGLIAYAPASTVPARVYFTTQAPCVNATEVIQYVEPDNPNSVATFDGSSLVNGPSSMVYDGTTYLYWANHVGNTIARKAVTGSAVAELVATSPSPPRQIVWVGGTLFWTTDAGLVRCVLSP